MINNNCLILTNYELFSVLQSQLNDHFIIYQAKNLNNASSIIQCNKIDCIIIQADPKLYNSLRCVHSIINNFPTIPFIAIIEENNLDIARFCGNVGVKNVVSSNHLNKLSEIIQMEIYKGGLIFDFKDFGIDINPSSKLIRDALEIIRHKYLEIASVSEIAHELGISEKQLSKKFIYHCSTGPKRLLTNLKIKHAIYLMKNPGLSLNEISRLVGICDQRRFNECFKRIFQISPSEYRKRLLVG